MHGKDCRSVLFLEGVVISVPGGGCLHRSCRSMDDDDRHSPHPEATKRYASPPSPASHLTSHVDVSCRTV
jgi:hypothetical protein